MLNLFYHARFSVFTFIEPQGASHGEPYTPPPPVQAPILTKSHCTGHATQSPQPRHSSRVVPQSHEVRREHPPPRSELGRGLGLGL